MKHLKVRFFGSFRVMLEDVPRSATLKTEKSRALFAYLLIENDRPHRRAKLIDIFWPDFPDKASHNSLRQSLYYIRSLLEDLDPAALQLMTSISDVQLTFQSGASIDAFELTSYLDLCEEHHKPGMTLCDACLEQLMAAIELYQGDFLDGFSLRDTPHFDWWLLNKRDLFRRRILGALAWVTHSLVAKQDYEQAISFAQREVELDPWREPAHQRYMTVLALAGERAQALHQFEICQTILATELGMQPSAETWSLCEQIRRDTLKSHERIQGKN